VENLKYRSGSETVFKEMAWKKKNWTGLILDQDVGHWRASVNTPMKF
jgi:hypothetical protein